MLMLSSTILSSTLFSELLKIGLVILKDQENILH